MKRYKNIDEAIYDMAAERIVRRKANPMISLAMLFAGLALIVTVYFIGNTGLHPNLESAMLLGGILIAFAGAVKIVIDLTGKGAPVHVESGSKLRRYELTFDMPYKLKVLECVNDGDLDALTCLPRGNSAAITVVIYKSADNEVAFTQAFGRESRDNRPLTETRYFEKGQFAWSERLA
ncbi:hypothetical protein LJC45_02630 [Alistipes sp. OttesenSCG-928-B03]|nr:hypothetical protein [Alistipes sp. OttesenSCG-928-B03]